MTGDEIRLAVPAAPEFARLARLTAAGLATRVGFSYDEVEDLRIAVGEACSVFISPEPSGQLTLEFVVGPTALQVTVTTDTAPPEPMDPDGMSRQILEAVVDSFELDTTRVTFVKQRLDQPGGSQADQPG